jgi:hypothetical protein
MKRQKQGYYEKAIRNCINYQTFTYNSCKWPTWRTFLFSTCLFQFSTCFEQPRAHHQENQFYQYIIWYVSLCVGDRLVCRSGSSGESIVSTQHLVCAILCRWPSSVHVGKELVRLAWSIEHKNYTYNSPIYLRYHVYYHSLGNQYYKRNED